ncbi:type VI secretion system protein TssR domain-containing protein [Chryseobacterium sp. TY3]
MRKSKSYINALSLVAVSYLFVGCNVRIPSGTTPKPEFYGVIDQVEVTDGFPEKPEPWVVFSERDNNSVFMDKGDQQSPKQIKFLEPLLVVKEDRAKGLVKVAEYNPDALMKKLKPSTVKTYGWIPKEQLLLWRNSVKNKANGFNLKATLVPNNSDVLKEAAKYLKNDSVMVFTSPYLTKETPNKLPVGQFVYIYKSAENGKRFLIGKTPSVKLDNISGNIYGWVSSNMVAVWGDRTGLRVSPDYVVPEENNLGLQKAVTDGTSENVHFRVSEAAERTLTENLIGVQPAEMRNGNKARFFTNALDYSKNSVFNVLGEPITYTRYREVANRNKNLNIVFTLDISNENAQNTAVAKSAFQDFQFKMKNLGYYKNIKFGAVLYKNNICGENVIASELSSDFAKVAQFIDERSAEQNCTGYGGQPMQEGLEVAGAMLTPHRDDTNLVVLVGATASSSGYMGNAVSTLSEARARIISYQTISGSSDAYNNFVLLSENVVTNTAKNIAELEKSRAISQNVVMNRNNYNLQQGEEGIYSLDYPKTSMTQGFVIYPKKGEINSNARLAKSLDSLISQVTHQNTFTENVLRDYFQSPFGSSKTELKAEYRPQFPTAPILIPTETASQLIVYGNPFLTKGNFSDDYEHLFPVIQKGILISELEYEDLKKLYQEIYQETMPYKPDFSPSKAINTYLRILKNSSTANKANASAFRQKSMAYSVAVSTGFDNSGEEILSKYMLTGWKKSKVVPVEAVRAYFKQYNLLSDRLLENKGNEKIIIHQNGEKFYWLNSYFMPMMTPRESL